MISEEILSKLVDDIQDKIVTVQGKSITVKSVMSDEFQDFDDPTVSITINPYSRGYGGLSKVKRVFTSGKMEFSQAVKADIELRVSAMELRRGELLIHPRYITEAIMEMVKKRVLVAWQRILVQYRGAVKDGSVKAERDLTRFQEAAGRSWRYLRVEVEYEDVWNYLLEGETADTHPVKGINFTADNEGESIDTETVVVNTDE